MKQELQYGIITLALKIIILKIKIKTDKLDTLQIIEYSTKGLKAYKYKTKKKQVKLTEQRHFKKEE